MNGKLEYGDYQTPLHFAEKVCLYLKNNRHIHPSAVLEPSCGLGNFIRSSLLFNAKEYYGIEINPAYCKSCKETFQDQRIQIINADFFSFSSKDLVKDKSNVLIIGNPPWATNSMLSAVGSTNLPAKKNFKGLKGLEAVTGAGNFDICEYMILRLINEYRDTDTVISMLCKTSVARNIFKEINRVHVSIEYCDILEFDASNVFGVKADACVLLIQLSRIPVSTNLCRVYDFNNPEEEKSRFGFSDGRFYSHICPDSIRFDGSCCFEWRQGVKHDCSKVMELTPYCGGFQNGIGEYIEIEADSIYPLVKSSMFKQPLINHFSKYVIVTQRKVREDTEHLAYELPKTWEYLNCHADWFRKRKSSIYHNSPPFSIFGIGSYSFAPYKVGVSGFYKKPLFSVLYSESQKPVMTDDTSYFICFWHFSHAYVAMLLLNSEKTQNFLSGIAFIDAKRPYTKKILSRIDIQKLTASVPFSELKQTEQHLRLSNYITNSMYDNFKSIIEMDQMSLL